ncbi:type II toxin-antitoxin system RelE/ParE family toxin [Halohasta litorea]|uniref:Type II toxin-antitoxin system RelE/ParE family toxin n=1 Tax=Halohasta litorea TaxID=869891 RepID=A0ABD6DEB6_9EURY|nr:type II toxin-antitoxin system RelE/ParE family toxin [Halohasta litorea]
MGISEFKVLDEDVSQDLAGFQAHEVDRIKSKIQDINTACVLGSRDPRFHHDYTKLAGGSDKYTFYRKWVGRDKFRLIFEVSGERMVLVAVLKKDDHAYNPSEYSQRMSEFESER